MKKYILILCASFALASCDEFENSAEASKITYLALFEMNGEDEIELSCDAEGYADEGATAILQGQEIEVTTSITGTYFGSDEINGPDLYQVSYAAANDDGIPAVAVRDVYWPACNGDLVNSIEGMYTAGVLRTATGGATVNYSAKAYGPYFIRDLGDGKYGLSDAIGGFYEYGDNYGYGSAYAATGMVITANDIAANDFTHDEVVGVGAFGGEAKVTDFSVDPVAKTVSFTTEWDAGYEFEVVLTQVE